MCSIATDGTSEDPCAAYAALEVADARAFAARLRLVLQACDGGGPQEWCPWPGVSVTRAEAAVAELAPAGGVSEYQVGRELDLARRMVGDHPDVVTAMEATVVGRDGIPRPGLSPVKVRLLDRLTRDLDMRQTAAVVARVVVARAADETPGEFARRVRRVVPAVAAQTVEARRQAAVDARRVGFRPEDDGTCTLVASGVPAPYAVAMDSVLDELAATAPDGDPRSLTQRRVDALMTCLLGPAAMLDERPEPEQGPDPDGQVSGTPRFLGVPARPASDEVVSTMAQVRRLLAGVGWTFPCPPRTTVEVVVDTRHGDAVTELHRYGPLDRTTADELLDRAVAVRLHDVADTHHAVCAGDPGYRPSAGTVRLVRARDRTCRWHGCSRRAERCDLDHVTPYAAGGSTCSCNLLVLCRRHHRLKHRTPWHLDLRSDAGGTTVTWVSPHGRVYVVRPPGRAPA